MPLGCLGGLWGSFRSPLWSFGEHVGYILTFFGRLWGVFWGAFEDMLVHIVPDRDEGPSETAFLYHSGVHFRRESWFGFRNP